MDLEGLIGYSHMYLTGYTQKAGIIINDLLFKSTCNLRFVFAIALKQIFLKAWHDTVRHCSVLFEPEDKAVV